MKLEMILFLALIGLNWTLDILFVVLIVRLSVQIERLKWQPFPKVSARAEERKNKLCPKEKAIENRCRRYKKVEGINAKVTSPKEVEDEDEDEAREDPSEAGDPACDDSDDVERIEESESADDV